MKSLVSGSLAFFFLLPIALMGAGPEEKCAAVSRSEALRQMGREELQAHRVRVAEQTSAPVAEAICESTAALTHTAYQNLLENARQENLKAGVPGFHPADLYFFLECGDDRVSLSPLAYHAFNLNRDEHGFIGESTLAIVWMTIGYLEVRDPATNRSFMETVERILTYARKNDSRAEIEMYEDLLLQIDGFREDYMLLVSECRLPRRSPQHAFTG